MTRTMITTMTIIINDDYKHNIFFFHVTRGFFFLTVFRYISSIITSTFAPTPSDPDQVMEFASVDFVASTVVMLLTNVTTYGQRYEIPTSSVSLSQLHAWIRNKGYPVHEIPFHEWWRKMKNSELPILPLMEFIDSMDYFSASHLVDCQECKNKLKVGAEIAPELITEDIVSIYLNKLKKHKLIK